MTCSSSSGSHSQLLTRLQNSYFEKLAPLLSQRENTLEELYCLTTPRTHDSEGRPPIFVDHENEIRGHCLKDLRAYALANHSGDDSNLISSEDLTEVVLIHLDVFIENTIRLSRNRVSFEAEYHQRIAPYLRGQKESSALILRFTESMKKPALRVYGRIHSYSQDNFLSKFLFSNPIFLAGLRCPNTEFVFHSVEMTEVIGWYRDAAKSLFGKGIFPSNGEGPSLLWSLIRVSQLWVHSWRLHLDQFSVEKSLDKSRKMSLELGKIAGESWECLEEDEILSSETMGFLDNLAYQIIEIHEKKVELKRIEDGLTEVLPQLIVFSQEASSMAGAR